MYIREKNIKFFKSASQLLVQFIYLSKAKQYSVLILYFIQFFIVPIYYSELDTTKFFVKHSLPLNVFSVI